MESLIITRCYMKKVTRLSLIILTFIITVCSLCACKSCYKLEGAYESESVYGTKTVYEFSGNEVKRTIIGELGSKTVEGEYEIRKSEDGGMTIILDFDADDTEAGEPWSLSVKDGYIEIAGIKYEKAK